MIRAIRSVLTIMAGIGVLSPMMYAAEFTTRRGNRVRDDECRGQEMK